MLRDLRRFFKNLLITKSELTIKDVQKRKKPIQNQIKMTLDFYQNHLLADFPESFSYDEQILDKAIIAVIINPKFVTRSEFWQRTAPEIPSNLKQKLSKSAKMISSTMNNFNISKFTKILKLRSFAKIAKYYVNARRSELAEAKTTDN